LPKVRQGDRSTGEEIWPIAIYLDHLRSAHNVGSIIRTVEALALGSLYFSPKTPFITHKQVQDTAMGSIQWTSCYQEMDLSKLPRPIIVLETCQEALSLYDFIFPSSFTLVVGNEEYGCSDETLKSADFLVEIPLRGHKNSLNVANAFAMVAGEICRQKRLKQEVKI
jgi:tRNA G18 (ribose-2'-O)-methylase SpoU